MQGPAAGREGQSAGTGALQGGGRDEQMGEVGRSYRAWKAMVRSVDFALDTRTLTKEF